jgi:hypothetical protein
VDRSAIPRKQLSEVIELALTKTGRNARKDLPKKSISTKAVAHAYLYNR